MKKQLDLTGLTFDDVQIIPNYSEIESRASVTTVSQFTRNHTISIPIVGAPMDTVCGPGMVNTLTRLGGIGCLHRFMSPEEHVTQLGFLFRDALHPIVGTIGATGDWAERFELLIDAGANVILVDVAHGDHFHVKSLMKELNRTRFRSGFDIILGNVATADGALRLQDWGADAIRVGIGGGSMCETRIRTGVGIPQLQAINDVASVVNIPLIADGGIRTPGDVCKALAAGADTVMLGSMLSGTPEAPGETIFKDGKFFKKFRGSASAAQKIANGAAVRYVEGAETLVSLKRTVEYIVPEIMDGVRSCMSYVGANNIARLYNLAQFIRITPAGLNEAHPHGVRS